MKRECQPDETIYKQHDKTRLIEATTILRMSLLIVFSLSVHDQPSFQCR